jgi:hypothetical protein
MGTTLAVEEWFIFRQDAALAYLKEVLREIRWKSTNDPFLRDLNLEQRGGLVEILPVPVEKYSSWGRPAKFKPGRWIPQTCTFRFEMDRGRRGLGHMYSAAISKDGNVVISMTGIAEPKIELEGDLESINAEAILDAIRQIIIGEVLSA